MNHSSLLRSTAALTAVALVLVACGQKPGVHVEGTPLAGEGFVQPDDLGEGDLGDQPLLEDPVDLDDDGPVAADPDAPAEPGQAAPAPGTQQQQQQQQQQEQTQARQPRGSDTTGLTDTTINIAIHAPVTGAAPLPSESFEKARDLYWRWVTEAKNETIVGRESVEVLFADDRYEPSNARQVCRTLASRAFLVVGGGGTDQIQACGQLAGQARFPYFSAGVTEAGLEGNTWYFGVSMTYKQQGPLLAQYVKKNFGNAKAAAIVTQTPNFNDAVQGWEAGVQQHGVNYHQTLRHPRGDQSWYSGFASQLADNDVQVVYMLTSPLDYIRFAQVARDQGRNFQYVGVGITMGLNDVLRNGCPAVNGGHFFSPFPSLEVVDRLDPEFRQAAQRFNAPSDDIALALWGIAKTQHELFKRYEQTFGTNLTREDFRDVSSNAGRIESGIFPLVEFSPQSHFGGRQVHVLVADCGSGRYKDGGTFKSSF